MDDRSDEIPEADNYGLGQRYLDFLEEQKDKIHQVDATSAMTETNGSVKSRGIQLAEQLLLKGVQQQDIIVICSRTQSDQTIAVLSTLLIGAIVAPLDPEYNIDELEKIVYVLKPRIIFCEIRMYALFDLLRKNKENGFYCDIILFGSYQNRLTLESLLINPPNQNFKATIIVNTRKTIAFICPSAATMGPSKLVSISHYAMKVQVYLCAEIILKGIEKILSFFPLSWIPQLILTCICFERPIVKVIAEVFTERVASRLIHDLRIDCALFGTSYALKFAEHPSKEDFNLGRLKVLYVGGRSTSAVDMANLRDKFVGVKVMQCYGCTEMCCLVAGLCPEEYEIAIEKPGTVGRLLPGFKTKIVCFDTGLAADPESWGKLYVSGPTMMLGYYNNVQDSKEYIEDDYFFTGDVARFDPDGFLYIQGRVADLIKTGGRRIFPVELEAVILTHPEIAECVVVGNEKLVVACVTRKEDCYISEEELTEYLEELLPERQMPSRIQFFDSFPKTTVGKVKIGELRDAVLKIPIRYSLSIDE